MVGSVEGFTPWNFPSIHAADAAVTSSRVRIQDILRDSTKEHGDNRDQCAQVGKIPGLNVSHSTSTPHMRKTYQAPKEKINFKLPSEPREASSKTSKSLRRLALRALLLLGKKRSHFRWPMATDTGTMRPVLTSVARNAIRPLSVKYDCCQYAWGLSW